MTRRLPIPSSLSFGGMMRMARFRDAIARPVRATPDAILRALRSVTRRATPTGGRFFRWRRRHDEAMARDGFLDRVMPRWDTGDRHAARIAAPAVVTFEAACDMDLFNAPLVRAIFKAREWLLRSRGPAPAMPPGILASARALGWGELASMPGREIVMGAVTKPWEPSPVFRALPPGEFAAFSEPGFVKIAWTLRADPVDAGTSIFRTETRAVATDAESRARFLRYWRLVSPGIHLIRRLSLGPLRREAVRRAGTSSGPEALRP
jgi:hypothetical protein